MYPLPWPLTVNNIDILDTKASHVGLVRPDIFGD